jgi:nucleotide-binding universal stress UspA family protein
MSRKRRSYETGHKPKFLVVIDDTPECDRAIYYASRRAARTGATVVMLRVIETEDRNQQWLGVADIMRAEAHEEANAALDRAAARANALALAAATGKEGPGPLVGNVSKAAGTYPIPVAIVPGHLSDDDLDALS